MKKEVRKFVYKGVPCKEVTYSNGNQWFKIDKPIFAFLKWKTWEELSSLIDQAVINAKEKGTISDDLIDGDSYDD